MHEIFGIYDILFSISECNILGMSSIIMHWIFHNEIALGLLSNIEYIIYFGKLNQFETRVQSVAHSSLILILSMHVNCIC